ncbi:MAG: DUF1566 domain-containing protein [Flavobacteriales bacterium]|nr:DUF1566 domain-containing protein [Flavobacteriales bacterium]
MKKILYILLLAPLVGFVSSCGKDIKGCTDSLASNYNSEATIYDNTCVYLGCTDDLACNYDSTAMTDDGSCEFAEQGYDCDGNIEYFVGMAAEGGIVFYVDETGEHGLVAAMEDIEGTYEWGCYGTDINGDNSSVSPELDGIGTGLQNTLEIVAGCSETPIAASEVLAYEYGDYSDWYLPSKDELKEMYNTIGNGGSEGDIGGFGNNWYWSSSESNFNDAWHVYFSNGDTISNGKNHTGRVRVIRAF